MPTPPSARRQGTPGCDGRGIGDDISGAKAYLVRPIHQQETGMPKFVIEREIPGVGQMKADELQAVSRHSCEVLQQMGPTVQWVQSYVTGNKIYCVYNAQSEAQIREHAQRGGFPANSVSRVVAVIDPTTAETTAA
ncbi:MAG: hypothetical protein NVS2B4_07030 [Ramlibacter sp.]